MKNGNARLIKANGEVASAATSEAINTVSILNAEIGNDLKLLLLGRVTSPETLELKGDDAKKASFTEALIARTRNAFKAEDFDSIIAALEEKQKEWGNRGGQAIAANLDEYSAWALGLASLTDNQGKPLQLMGTNSDGVSVMMPLEQHLKASVTYCLYALTSLSNVAFKGTPEKVTNKGKVKKSKPGLFDNDKGVESTRINGYAAGSEDWQFRAKVTYLVTDVGGASGSKIRKSLELINDAANRLNNDKTGELGLILRTLTGQNREDKRFAFNPSLIANLIFARFCGLMYSGIAQWLRELKEAQQKGNTIAAFAADEEMRLALMIQDIARREAFSEHHPDPKPETIPGSRVESSDTTATLPESSVKPITWRDRAQRRFSKQVWARYSEKSDEEKAAIIERGIEQNIANADEGADFTIDATFEEYFSASAINEYLDAEDADALEAEIESEEKRESTQNEVATVA